MKKIAILGAAGRTGQLLVDQAVAAGYEVVAFVRDTGETMAERPHVSVVSGDARRPEDLIKVLKGQDAVISTLGSSKPGDRVIADSTISLIEAAHQTGVKRVIMMSSFLATKNFQPHPIIKFALRLMGSIVSDIHSGEGRLQASDLDYTIVYATRLTNEPLNPHFKIVGADEEVGATDSISRADVASFLLQQLTDTTYVRKTVLITDK